MRNEKNSKDENTTKEHLQENNKELQKASRRQARSQPDAPDVRQRFGSSHEVRLANEGRTRLRHTSARTAGAMNRKD